MSREFNLDAVIKSCAAWVFTEHGGKFTTRWDVQQELHLYALGPGKVPLARADEMTAFRLLRAAGRWFVEKEKADHEGYNIDDVHWYTPDTVVELIPLALDPTFTGEQKTEGPDMSGVRQIGADIGGNLLAMVLDVRRVLAERKDWVLTFSRRSPGDDLYDATVLSVVDALGGQRPDAPGYRKDAARRKVISNEQARSLLKGEGFSNDRAG